MSPAIKSIHDLPADILLLVPAIDICTHEELTFVERVKADLQAAGVEDQRTVEAVVFGKAFHGWFERKCRSTLLSALLTHLLQYLIFPKTCRRTRFEHKIRRSTS